MLSIKGYILEKPRVGTSNSVFTASPDNVVSDPGAYSIAFGTDESNPGRCEYVTLVTSEGDLPDAEFGWTKNESGVQRFDYDGMDDRFRPLPGAPRQLVGTLASDSNVNRIQVPAPTASSVVSPYRVSVGSIGSGTTFLIQIVSDDASFTVPPLGQVQLSLDTGNLNWNPSDLVTYEGQEVYFQRQNFFSRQESSGKLGAIGDIALLNPIPGTGQHPLVRIGFGLHLTPVEKATDANLSVDPVQGTVEWSLETGLLKFNSTDISSNVGEPVYYDGALFASGLTLPRQTLGTVSAPASISGMPPAGGDLIFRATSGGVTYQFPEVVWVDDFTSGKAGVVQVKPSGAVQFSASDISKYGSYTVEVILCDLPLERGLSLRLFRSPVDLEGTNPDVKDVSALVVVDESTLADPIIGAPQVSLPILPIDDPSYPMVVAVEQGTGTFTGSLPRLDVPNPPSGVGYSIDFENRQLLYSTRKNNQLVAIPERTAAVSLPDILVNPANASLELNQGSGFVPLTPGVDVVLDPTSGVVTFVDSTGSVAVESSTGQVSDTTKLVDLFADFVSSGVTTQDLLVVTAGPLQGVYSITSVLATELGVSPSFPSTATALQYQVRKGSEVLADRFFQEVVLVDPQTKVERLRSLGAISNSPRLTIERVHDTRVRLPSGTIVTPTVVPSDTDFTALSAGLVQVSSETGNLNFSSADISAGGNVTEIRKLTQGVDYRMSPELGFIQFTDRMLALDEVWVTYASESDPSSYNLERGTFLVRKELVNHPIPASTLSFNQAGRTVASSPVPAVFRGGRPQTPSQVSINTASSTITFLPDVLPTPGGAMSITDAIPHGATVQPNERVYIDYYVYEALGGENTITVLSPPIHLARVNIIDGETTFEVPGDWTSSLPANRLLRVGSDQVYYITGSSYDGVKTTVTVGQPFRDDFLDPRLFVSSGEVLLVGPSSYFVLETASFDPVPRGMNVIRLKGDQSSLYQSGTVVYFTGSGVTEFYLVSGSKYDAESDKTEITLTQTSSRQYSSPSYVLRRSVRPIFDDGVSSVRTSEAPLVISPATSVEDSIVVFRRASGSAGVILGPGDFRVDASGKIDLAQPLLPNESVEAFYTRYRFVNPGTLRASYTATIVPSDSNGLLGQRLVASFTSYLPDSFYFRVETMSAFRSEVAQAYREEARASSPSGGPRTSNTASPRLHEQGSPSVFFEEGYLANEDIIARATLKYYNDTINYLEDLLRNLDGRVVGDYDGKFKFDGTTGSTVSSFSNCNNQIDDRVKLSDFPIDKTPPLFPLKFKGTYQRAYEPSTESRFYPTFRRRFGYTVAGAKTGDPILDFETKNLTSAYPTLDRRTPRAVVTRSAKAGDTTIYVDTADQVDTDPFRPAFASGMSVVIQDPSGSFYVGQGSPLSIQSKTSTSLTFTGGLPTDVPIGASVYLADSDTTYRKSYRIGFDVTLDNEKGYALYVKPYPPFDGSAGGVPAELEVKTPNSDELLETGVFLSNSLTSPYRFPALDGLPLDDDGDQRLPLINPSPAREMGSPGYLSTEDRYLDDVSGVLATETSEPFVGVGDISPNGLTITLSSGSFPMPVPQPGDLVRTLNGLNGQSEFRRVVSTNSNSVTVDVAFDSAPDTGVTFLVTTSPNVTTGSFDSIVGSTVVDSLADFISSGVRRGYTVVKMGIGLGQYERRQIVSVDSATQLTLDAPFSDVTVPLSYRICNTMNTYNEIQDLEDVASDLLDILQTNPDSEINSLDNFLTSVLDDRLSPASTSGNVSGTILTGTGVDFITSGVQVGDIVYVTPTQTNQGFYLIEEVIDATNLRVSASFPSNGPVSFRVVNVFGFSVGSLNDLLEIRTETANFYANSTAWASLVSTPVPVLVPPGVSDSTYFTRGYAPSDLAARRADISNRLAYLPGAISKVETILASSDRLYDKRYVWIDARINLEKGILVSQQRAEENRVKAQQEILNQLTKLLAVQ